MALATGDFNRDGRADVAVLNDNGMLSVLLGNGKSGFGAPKPIATLAASSSGGIPQLVAADFNGDGNTDLVVLQPPGSVLAVYSGRGDGSFAARVEVNDGLPSAGRMAIGDFDGDGLPDVAVAGASSIAVLLARSGGVFRSPIVLTTPFQVADSLPMALGDVNQDGHLDIVASNEFGKFQFLLGDGSGHFKAETPNLPSDLVNAMAMGDFNHDGKPDLALAASKYTDFNNGYVIVIFGNGDGTFQQQSAASLFRAPNAISSMQVTNVDGVDGLVFPSDPLYVLTQNTSGQLSEASYAAGGGPVGVGDFSGDGKQDIVVANESGIQVLVNAGGGVLRAPLHRVLFDLNYTSLVSLGTTDLNWDGFPDLAVIQNTNEHSYNGYSVGAILGGPNGQLNPIPSTQTSYSGQSVQVSASAIGQTADTGQAVQVPAPAIGDFNHDGHLDVAYAGTPFTPFGSFYVFRVMAGDGQGHFTPLTPVLHMVSRALAAGYYNADGDADLASVDGESLQVLIGNGDGSFKSPVTYAVGSNPVFVMQRDLNADGKRDLVVVNQDSDEISILLGNGDGTFRDERNFSAGTSPKWAVTGDFNRDGKVDLAVGGNSGVSVLLGNGDGTFQPERDYPATGSLTMIAQASVRQDGVECLLGIDSISKRFVLLPGLGDGTFASPKFFSVDRIPTFFVVGDFNGDGAPDVVLVGSSVYTQYRADSATGVVVFYNQGGNFVSLSSNPSSPRVGQHITLSARVNAGLGELGRPTGMVYFKDGTQFLGRAPLRNGVAALTVHLTGGNHVVSAFYSGDTTFNTSHSPVLAVRVAR